MLCVTGGGGMATGPINGWQQVSPRGTPGRLTRSPSWVSDFGLSWLTFMRWLGRCCAGLRVPGSREADLRTSDGSYVTYSQGITSTTQAVTAAISESCSCGPLGSVTLGSGSLTISQSASCLSSVSEPGSTRTCTWNSPSGSGTISFPATAVTQAAGGTTAIVCAGTVTSGLGQGEVATPPVVLPRLNPDECGSAQAVAQESGPRHRGNRPGLS